MWLKYITVLVAQYCSSNIAIHRDLFTYIFLVYYLLLGYFTIVYTTFFDTITCRRNYGLFHHGCETYLTLGFLLTAIPAMYFIVVYRVLNILGTNYLLVMDEQSLTREIQFSSLIANFKCRHFSDSISSFSKWLLLVFCVRSV